MAELIEKLEQIEELDLEKARRHLPTQEQLLSAIKRFITICDAQVEELKQYRDSVRDDFASDDFMSYRIQAHTMKSLLRSIGADLFDEAYELEKAGRNENLDMILKYTDDFVEKYLCLADRLRDALGEEDTER